MTITKEITNTPYTATYELNESWAKAQDNADPLSRFREQFHFPKHTDGSPITYLCGNSLGLQPKTTRAHVEKEMNRWETLGVEGHFKGENPWLYFHKLSQDTFAMIMGAHPDEVIAMNNLTVNLHLMMVSFYKPTNTRYKILVEGGAFPSDQYAFETQAIHHGLNPADAIVEMKPRAGEKLLRTEDIIATINELGDSLALVLFGGINYYTGQVFDMKAITQAAHDNGAYCGFDCAHAAGNVPMQLHDWQVDFAVWCTYKYINSGPGAVAGAFVHRNNFDKNLNRFAGWWGYEEKTRFLMTSGFVPMEGAAGWQLSNTNVISHAALHASLEIFAQTSMQELRAKSEHLTGYLAFVVQHITSLKISVLTPLDACGAQLSLVIEGGKAVFNYLLENGIIGDWREPDVIRISPAPLYNNYSDVFRFYSVMQNWKK